MVSIIICKGLFGKVRILDMETKEELWTGKSGETAEFELPEGKDEAEIGLEWGPFSFRYINAKDTVKRDGKYGLFYRMSFFGAKYYLVDVGEA